MIYNIGILVLLIILKGFFSLSEMAVVSVNINKVKLRSDQGDRYYAHIKNIKENPTRFISTIQIGISFLSAFTGAYAANIFAEPLLNRLMKSFDWVSAAHLPLVILVTTVLVTYFTLVFGELVPKRLAIAKSLEISRFVAMTIPGLVFLFSPVSKILSVSSDVVFRITRVKENEEEDITEEEIRMLVDASGEKGSIDESELEMINAVFEFDDITAGELLTHRKKLVAIDANAQPDALKSVLTSRFSRIPVYDDNIDNVIGILYVRDLLEFIINGGKLEDADIRSVMRKPYFVHESKKAHELFKHMQTNKQHMAVVVDEYGGTIGIITMEDLIEAIMGNIQDEFDEEEEAPPEIKPIYGCAYLVDGEVSIDDTADFFETDFPDEDHDTISGFLISEIGRIPENNEHPEVLYNDIVFKVLEMDEKRIKSIIACRAEVVCVE